MEDMMVLQIQWFQVEIEKKPWYWGQKVQKEICESFGEEEEG